MSESGGGIASEPGKVPELDRKERSESVDKQQDRNLAATDAIDESPAETEAVETEAAKQEITGSNPQSSEQKPAREIKPVIPLRPLYFGEIFSGAATVMWRYAAWVFGASFLVALIAAASDFGLGVFSGTPLSPFPPTKINIDMVQNFSDSVSLLNGSALWVNLAQLFLTTISGTFLSGFLIILVGRAVLGRSVTFTEIIAELKPRFWPLLGLTIIYTVLVAVGFAFFVVPGIWLSVVFMFATSALVLERGRIGQALGRSYLLTLGAWFRSFGVLLVAGLLAQAVNFLLRRAFRLDNGLLSTSAPSPQSATNGYLLSQAAVDLLSSTVVTPFVVCVTTIAYLDQRMRKEKLDISLKRTFGGEFLR